MKWIRRGERMRMFHYFCPMCSYLFFMVAAEEIPWKRLSSYLAHEDSLQVQLYWLLQKIKTSQSWRIKKKMRDHTHFHNNKVNKFPKVRIRHTKIKKSTINSN